MEKFTPLAKILHCRRHWRHWQIPPLWSGNQEWFLGPWPILQVKAPSSGHPHKFQIVLDVVWCNEQQPKKKFRPMYQKSPTSKRCSRLTSGADELVISLKAEVEFVSAVSAGGSVNFRWNWQCKIFSWKSDGVKFLTNSMSAWPERISCHFWPYFSLRKLFRATDTLMR